MNNHNINVSYAQLNLVPYNALANKEVIKEEIAKKLKALRKETVPLRDI